MVNQIKKTPPHLMGEECLVHPDNKLLCTLVVGFTFSRIVRFLFLFLVMIVKSVNLRLLWHFRIVAYIQIIKHHNHSRDHVIKY